MNAMSSPAQSEFHAGLLPVEPVEAPAVCPAGLKNDRSPIGRRSLRKRVSRTLSGFLITFCIGVAATLVWQSYGDAAREMIANSYPQLGWLAPQADPATPSSSDMTGLAASSAPSFDQQQLNVISIDLEAVRQGIDRIAPSMAAGQEQIDRIAATQEQIARTVDRLAAGQEQVIREITKLQAVEQYILYKNSEPPPRPTPAQVRNPVPRPSQAPIVR